MPGPLMVPLLGAGGTVSVWAAGGRGVRAPLVPLRADPLESPGQPMPGPVRVPLLGAGDTVSAKAWTAKVAVTDWFAVMVTVHPPLPEHAPLHALSVPPPGV